MEFPKEMLEAVLDAINQGNKLVTKGVNIPLSKHGDRINLAMPNWEDPRVQLKIPARDPNTPNFTFSLGANLDWHRPIKEAAQKQFDKMLDNFR
ncbi:hypothetical protein CCP3SC15_2750005 [Gammaproteobacteria bacterium]